jgi:hypothetical protein
MRHRHERRMRSGRAVTLFNAGGGLFKAAGGTNQYIESSNDNYVTSNGWDPASPPDAVPATIPLR